MQLLRWLTARTADMLALLKELVELESPSTDKDAVDRLGARIAAELERVGAAVRLLPGSDRGDHIRAQSGAGASGSQVLVLCHMDTVWPVGEVQRRPFRVEGGRALGPGTQDMKAGIVQLCFALAALAADGRKVKDRVVALVTSDEEIGSGSSRQSIEDEARRSRAVLVLEPAAGSALKTSRKGVGGFAVKVEGRAAHAGADPERGISAIEELAWQTLKLQRLTSFASGTTVNVGVVSGGSRTNVVAASAEAKVDVRVVTAAEGEKVAAAIRGLTPFLEGARVSVTGGIGRPPMERTPGNLALFNQARELGRELGLELTESSSGGGSDGNFTSALGVPTLDGLGAVGDGAHSVDEWVLVESLPQRAAVLGRLLETI
ncbi:MAG: M20 family metallopeptidase [Bacillota bacterium]